MASPHNEENSIRTHFPFPDTSSACLTNQSSPFPYLLWVSVVVAWRLSSMTGLFCVVISLITR